MQLRIGEDNATPGGGARLTREEFALLFAREHGSLCIVAAAVVGPGAAEDAVQDAALVALDRLARFRRGTDFRAWMSAIVRGVAKNHRRAATRRTRRERAAGRPEADRAGDGAVGGEARFAVAPGTGAAVELRLSDDFDASVRNALADLEPYQRACLLLRTVSGHSYAEVAAMLGLREATARSHVLRARRRLLKSLAPGGSGDAGVASSMGREETR